MSDVDPYGQKFSIATLTDAPNAEALARALAGLGSVAEHVLLWYADADERAATLVGSVAPTDGTATWLIDPGRLDVYSNGAWKPINPDLVATNSGATSASGFTVISFSGWRDGRVTTINACWSRTAASIFSDPFGNIGDTTLGTLPTGWRPPETIYGTVGDGFAAGECSIGPDGTVTVRAWSPNPNESTTNGGIITGRNIRLTSTFIQPSP